MVSKTLGVVAIMFEFNHLSNALRTALSAEGAVSRHASTLWTTFVDFGELRNKG